MKRVDSFAMASVKAVERSRWTGFSERVWKRGRGPQSQVRVTGGMEKGMRYVRRQLGGIGRGVLVSARGKLGWVFSWVRGVVLEGRTLDHF